MSGRPVAAHGPYARFGKRAFDVVLSAMSLIAFAPLFLLVAGAIRILDPGPAIFRQTRVGRYGALFRISKFRSMPVGTGDIPSDRLGHVELKPIGRLIRRTNLDELPQLWHILIGDMSFVGPRPAIPPQTELLALRQQNGAAALRPGLTGLAQINGYDGMPVPEKAAYDGRYAERISFLKDFVILLRTFGYLRRPPPKY